MEEKISEIVASSQKIVVVQADNPDGDSLGSSLALEQILSELDKEVVLYCGVDMPDYLKYLGGWDRVVKDLPNNFDASIIVDASTYTLLEQLDKTGQLGFIKTKPSIVLDHHAVVEKKLDFASAIICDDETSSTGELIYKLARKLAWPLDKTSGENIMTAILGDTQGLSNELARVSTYNTMAELLQLGVDRPALEELRRTSNKMAESIYRYKAKLITRTELVADGRIASVTVPQAEINEFSPLYNPAALIQPDMLQIDSVAVAIVFKSYDDGKVTAAIRSNHAYPMAGQLAEAMGGGGHAHAAGFKIESTQSLETVKSKCLETAEKLLNNLS